MLPPKLAIAVTFHYVEARLQYLNIISDYFSSLADEVKVVIVTNTSDEDELQRIHDTVGGKGFEYSFFTPYGLGHPYLLAWSHLYVFRRWFDDQSISHFMYLEDDILLTKANIEYWTAAREVLRQYNVVPSFLRVEKKDGDDRWYSSDCLKAHDINELPRINFQSQRMFVNLPRLYQGMYLLDRPLMAEHLAGPTSIPEHSPWGIREKAAAGITFCNVQKGMYSRNFIPFVVHTQKIDTVCFIHHTPNNYANDPNQETELGKMLADDVLYIKGIQ